MVVWELPDSYFTYLRSSWESCWLSEKLLGIVLATKVLGVILADWKPHVFGKLLKGFEGIFSTWEAPASWKQNEILFQRYESKKRENRR